MRTLEAALLVAAMVAVAPFSMAAESSSGSRELRVGILPDADSLPLLVADDEGLFAAEGLAVRLVPFKTAVERDAALQSGAVDGAIADLLAAALAAQAGFDFRVTSLTDGRYGIVAAPGSGLARPEDLAGIPVGISVNTIIQYAAETLLRQAGLPPASIQGLAVPNIQVRMELLLSGRLKAACLPEPLLMVAKAKGAVLIAASDDAGLGAGVLMFQAGLLDSRIRDLSAFYRAYAKAAERLNAEPSRYRPFLVERAGFPAEAKDSFVFLRYAKPRLPSLADVSKALAWMKSKGLLSREIDPASFLDGRAIEPGR